MFTDILSEKIEDCRKEKERKRKKERVSASTSSLFLSCLINKLDRITCRSSRLMKLADIVAYQD